MACAKRRRFAEMNVGDEQCALAGPVQRALGIELHALAAQRALDASCGITARYG